MRSCLALSTLAVMAAVAACAHDGRAPMGCGMTPMVDPGILIIPGIDLKVRDPYGRAQAIGTTYFVQTNTGTDSATWSADTLDIYTAFDQTGTFNVTLRRPYYRDKTIDNIVVTANDCGLKLTTVPVGLVLAPGAPPLRSVIILGAMFLDRPGAQGKLVPHFDADPGVSTAMTWQVNDTALTTVDANGVVTAKCTKDGGAVKVTGTAVADGKTSAYLWISVARSSSCP